MISGEERPISSNRPLGAERRPRRTSGGPRGGANPEHGACPDCLIVRAIAGLSIGLILTETNDRIVWLNRAAERMLGLPADVATNRRLQDLLRDPQLADFWRQAGARSGNVGGQVNVSWPSPCVLKVNATNCTDAVGAELGRALLFCDVTAEQAVSIELTQAVASRLLDLTDSRPPPAPIARLTPQERRILQLLGQGCGNEEISTTVGVAPSTVRSHLKNIYRKLDLRSRGAAVRFAVQHRF